MKYRILDELFTFRWSKKYTDSV